MFQTYAFSGDELIGRALNKGLQAAGFRQVERLEDADVFVTMCLGQEPLEEACFGSDGAVARMRSGSLLLDFGASTPSFSKELSAMCEVSGLHAVEAPLVVRDPTRSDAFAARENLCAYVAGADDAVALALPLVEAVAGTVRRCGAAGAGQLTKCMCTLMQAEQAIALVEADALAQVAGDEEAEQLASRIADEGFMSQSSMALYRAVADEAFVGVCSIEVMMADLLAALDAAEESELTLPQAEAAFSLLQLLSVIGGYDMNPAGLSLLYSDDEQIKRFGLDWSRAEDAYGSLDDEDAGWDEDDGWDEGAEAGKR